MVIPELEAVSKEGESGRQKLTNTPDDYYSPDCPSSTRTYALLKNQHIIGYSFSA